MEAANKKQLLIDFASLEVQQNSIDTKRSTAQIFKFNNKKTVFSLYHQKKKDNKELLRHIIHHGKSF